MESGLHKIQIQMNPIKSRVLIHRASTLVYLWLEIRSRIFYLIFSFLLTFLIGYSFSAEILYIIVKPLLRYRLLNPSCEVGSDSPHVEISLNQKPLIPEIFFLGRSHHVTENMYCTTKESNGTGTTKTDALLESDFLPTTVLEQVPLTMIFTDISEPFYAILYLCWLSSWMLNLGFLMYHVWSFFLPSINQNQRILLNAHIFWFSFTYISTLFLLYWKILPVIYQFFLSYEMKSAVLSVKLEARIFPYILFIFQILGTYSLGVFIVFTALLLRNLDFMNFIYIRKNRKIFFFLCIVVAALVAPPDVYSQGTITLLLWLSVEFLIFIDCYMQALNSQPVSN